MPSCKECGEIVGVKDIDNGICKRCQEKGVKSKEPTTKKEVVYITQKYTGLIPGIIASFLAILGILTLGVVFVPLAALVALIGSIIALKNGSISGIGTNLLAWVLVIVGFITSPLLIVMLGLAVPPSEYTSSTSTEISTTQEIVNLEHKNIRKEKNEKQIELKQLNEEQNTQVLDKDSNLPKNLRITINNVLVPLLEQWNNANNTKNIQILNQLYAEKIKYYGTSLSREECIKDKKRVFKKLPNFIQKSQGKGFVVIDENTYKILLDKIVQTTPNNAAKMFPSYLIVDTSSSMPKIIEEGDYITNWNLRKRKLKSNDEIETLNCSQKHNVTGYIDVAYDYGIPNFGEDPESDSLSGAYILHLEKPIIVLDNGNECDYGESIKTYDLQLVPIDDVAHSNLNEAVKQYKKVELSGKFFTAHTGHHVRDLLFEIDTIK